MLHYCYKCRFVIITHTLYTPLLSPLSSSPSLLSLPPPVFPALRERLGDAKEQVREQAQQLTQKLMVEVVSSPQHFLDK